MPEMKTVTSKFTLGVACPDKSTKDAKGKFTEVVLKHIKPGDPVPLPADEADDLIARGQAVEAVVEPAVKPKKSDD